MSVLTMTMDICVDYLSVLTMIVNVCVDYDYEYDNKCMDFCNEYFRDTL
jgi:hypothetical protein